MPPPRQAVKISDDIHAELRRLVAHAAKHGWTAFGVDRDDPPTQAAIIEEAIRLLAARIDSKPRSKR